MCSVFFFCKTKNGSPLDEQTSIQLRLVGSKERSSLSFWYCHLNHMLQHKATGAHTPWTTGQNGLHGTSLASPLAEGASNSWSLHRAKGVDML